MLGIESMLEGSGGRVKETSEMRTGRGVLSKGRTCDPLPFALRLRSLGSVILRSHETYTLRDIPVVKSGTPSRWVRRGGSACGGVGRPPGPSSHEDQVLYTWPTECICEHMTLCIQSVREIQEHMFSRPSPKIRSKVQSASS